MARSKVTISDIYARLARGECANYRQNGCRGQSPCTIVGGEPCDYFTRYVKPLLDYPEFSAKYQREAKVTLAINPNAKVVRTRRTSTEPRLDLGAPVPTTSASPRGAKATAPASVKPKTAAKPVANPALPATPPKASARPPKTGGMAKVPAAPALLLTTEPAAPGKAKAKRAPKTADRKPAPIPPPAPQLALELTPPGAPARKAARKR